MEYVSTFEKYTHKQGVNIKKYKIYDNDNIRMKYIVKEYTHIEEDAESSNVIKMISNDEWEPQNVKKFKKAMGHTTRKEMLSDYTDKELVVMKLFKLKNYNIGYGLKPSHGNSYDIVNVFNNEKSVKGIGSELVNSAIRNGGCYLDHFDGFLTKFYKKLGFVEYQRDVYDPQYDEDGSLKAKYGEVDVIYRKHKNCN